MNSSLHLSMLSAEEEIEQASHDDDVDEIEVIQKRITDVRILIDKINEDYEYRNERNQRDLKNLVIEIEEAKKISKEALANQEQEHNEKIKDFAAKLKDEKKRFEKHYEMLLKQSEQYEISAEEIEKMKKNYILYEQQRKNILTESKAEDEEKQIEMTELQKILSRKMLRFKYQQQIMRLEQEISELHYTRREDEKKFKLKRSDLLNKLEVSKTDHDLLIKRLTKDMDDRDHEYDIHLTETKKQIEKLNSVNEQERQTMTTQCNKLQDLSLSITRNSGNHLSRINKDIEQMTVFIEEAEKEEMKTLEENAKNSKKLFESMKNTNSLRENIFNTETELTQTNTFNSMSSMATKKITTPPPKRKVKKQAIFT